jgi:3-deoxy-D-manno-octulosonic-acid transferase
VLLSLRLYRTATTLAAPFLGLVLQARARDGKEDFLRIDERFARKLPPRLPGALVWLHGASVGESLLLLELGRRLIAARPGLMLVFTSQTLTSARLMGAQLPDAAIHLMAPLDTPAAARRFISHWKPDVCVFGEGEIWPNLIHESARLGARRALVNARMTETSAAGWARWRGLFASLLGSFDVILAAERLQRLLGTPIAIGGNLKSALPVPAASVIEQQRMAADFVAGRRCYLAASTHDGEEALFLDALAGEDDTALIIAPRHPERGDAVEAELKSRGLTFARRTRHEAPNARTRVLLADTMGEMGLWLRLADAVYLGGGHAPDVGGHNPLEPLRLGKPVCSGPHVFNFAGLVGDLQSRGLITLVADAGALGAALKLAQPPDATALADLAARADAPMNQTLVALLPLLPEPGLLT